MELIRNLSDPGKSNHPCVATIGNFDGVHVGHQAVISQLRKSADALGLPAVVMTFEPLPLEYFSPRTAPTRLTGFRQKIELLERLSVDKVVCLRFGKTLASLPADQFIKELLVDGLGIKRLIVGDDFHFGKDRQGNIALLNESAEKYGFEVIPTDTFDYNGVRVSSSLVRGHLALGDFEYVKELLGRPYQISGKIIHGDKRGKTLGFPTANIALKRPNTPLAGVYAVQVHGINDKVYGGVANIGTRPVFSGDKVLLETFIFDFNEEIYGKRINVEFMKHLRDERDFFSVEELCAQMEKDAEKARQFLARAKNKEKDER
ncbi:MAG: bifunctional riboflavin kinase/FAD synthetase [Gammaproteobacteria bacterium]